MKHRVNVHLTPELERFVRECVESGLYSNVSEVVRSGLRLLQAGQERRCQFEAMLKEAEVEADRAGTHDLDSVLAEMDEVIAGCDERPV